MTSYEQKNKLLLPARSMRPLLIVGFAVALAGCASMEQQAQAPGAEPTAEAAAGPVAVVSGVNGGAAKAEVDPAAATESAQETGPVLYRGTGEMVRMPKRSKPITFRGKAVSLDFEQAPLTEVVHAIMGDILKLDYIIEHPIGGEVTLRTRAPVPRDQLLDILESLLKANEALMIRDKDGRFFVSGSGQMSRLKPSVAASTAGVAGYTTVIVPLTHISAQNMAEILRPVADEAAFVRIDNLRNLLMLAGTRSQLEGWQEIIDTFDVDLLKGMSVGMFPIENTSIAEIDAALGALIGGGGEGDESLIGAGGLVKIIPIERLSSLMVVARRHEYLVRIAEWIKRLDSEPAANFERRLYVYPVQNSNAAHLANLLSSVYGGSLGGSATPSSSGTSPGLTPEKVTDGGGKTQPQKGPVSSGPQTAQMGDVRVVADDENNALLIYATAREYQRIRPALDQLDVAATQVIIEASIIEVTLTETLKYGIDWTFESGGLDGGFRGTGASNNLGILGANPASLGGFTYSVINAAGDISAVLNMLATDDLLNVISSPSVMVLDNQTAEIQVGDQVPIETSNVTGETISTSVSYRDTGVQLSVTPSVNAGGMVTMDIEQSVTDVSPSASGASQPTFLERSIVSRVAVRSTESIVLGGLIRDNKQKDSSGIPLLKDIPLIGGIFGAQGTNNRRTELLVVITPRVIYNDSELRDVSREMRSQMRGLELLGESDLPAFLSNSAEQAAAEEE
ncbi:MAG: type II secretion system secretin GspD [Halioglobus sp.]|nr:type II secretion system secretin GspD [Halioglobus sp.]